MLPPNKNQPLSQPTQRPPHGLAHFLFSFFLPRHNIWDLVALGMWNERLFSWHDGIGPKHTTLGGHLNRLGLENMVYGSVSLVQLKVAFHGLIPGLWFFYLSYSLYHLFCIRTPKF